MKSLFTIILACFLLWGGTHQVQAAGVSTNTATGAGQVKTNRNGDVLYLSTDTNAGAPLDATLSASATSSGETATNSGLSIANIKIPTGFATDAGKLINSLTTIVMLIATLLVFFYLIWAGIKWITAGDDKSKTQAAQSQIISAIVGLLILAASYAVLLLVLQFLGFTSLSDVFQNVKRID
jgi:hypothetical protein